nr:unnamed protein product [Callosobruchus analis]
MADLPVSTSADERSSSRRLKTYLRSTIKGDRLNGLASIHIHPNLELNEQSEETRLCGSLYGFSAQADFHVGILHL